MHSPRPYAVALASATLLALTACGQQAQVTEVADATAGPVKASENAAQPGAGCLVGGDDIPADAAVAQAGTWTGMGRTTRSGSV